MSDIKVVDSTQVLHSLCCWLIEVMFSYEDGEIWIANGNPSVLTECVLNIKSTTGNVNCIVKLVTVKSLSNTLKGCTIRDSFLNEIVIDL